MQAMAGNARDGMICAAIHARKLLQFEYHGLQRVVAPYCHGISTRGVEVFRGVQVRGSSKSGGLGFGKLWTVAEVKHPTVLNERFDADDPDYNPEDSAMTTVHCRV